MVDSASAAKDKAIRKVRRPGVGVSVFIVKPKTRTSDAQTKQHSKGA